jgi:hypothetical protein
MEVFHRNAARGIWPQREQGSMDATLREEGSFRR